MHILFALQYYVMLRHAYFIHGRGISISGPTATVPLSFNCICCDWLRTLAHAVCTPNIPHSRSPPLLPVFITSAGSQTAPVGIHSRNSEIPPYRFHLGKRCIFTQLSQLVASVGAIAVSLAPSFRVVTRRVGAVCPCPLRARPLHPSPPLAQHHSPRVSDQASDSIMMRQMVETFASHGRAGRRVGL